MEGSVFSEDSHIPNSDGLSIPSMFSPQAESPSDVGLGMSLRLLGAPDCCSDVHPSTVPIAVP